MEFPCRISAVFLLSVSQDVLLTTVALIFIFLFFIWRLYCLVRKQQVLLKEQAQDAENQRISLQHQLVEAQNWQRETEASRDRALLRVRAITNQIDPHFVSNFLTAIQSLIYKQELEKVVSYLAKFGSIFRLQLLSGNQVYWQFHEEMEFVLTYLDLEKVRFAHIDSIVELDPLIPADTMIPKMLVQGYVSNAIKHGLENKPNGGIVQVYVKILGTQLHVRVEDNGVGLLDVTKSYQRLSNDKGLSINAAIFKELNLYNKEQSYQTCNDLGRSGKSGLVIEAFIPLHPVLPPDDASGEKIIR